MMTLQSLQHLQTVLQTNAVCSTMTQMMHQQSCNACCVIFSCLQICSSMLSKHTVASLFFEETEMLHSVVNNGLLMLQALQAAAASHSADPTDHSAAQHLVACLGKAKDAAETRPKVWLSLVESEDGVLQALVAGLLSWQMPSALERALQLVMLLLPAPEIPKDGLK